MILIAGATGTFLYKINKGEIKTASLAELPIPQSIKENFPINPENPQKAEEKPQQDSNTPILVPTPGQSSTPTPTPTPENKEATGSSTKPSGTPAKSPTPTPKP